MNLFLKILVTGMIFFTPFSFAATEPWAFAILQGLVLSAWVLVLFSRMTLLYPSFFKTVLSIFLVLIVLALLQCCAPHTLLDKAPWYPSTLMRLYTLEHVSILVTYLAVVVLIPQIYPSFDEVKQLVWWLTGAAVAVEFCVLLCPEGAYISGLTGMQASADSVGPFLNRNHAGVFFAMNALLALGLFFTHQLHYQKLITKEQKRAFIVQQVCLGLFSIGLLLAAIFTRSRGAMLALLLGIFGYAFLCVCSVPSQLRKRLKRIFYTFVLLLVSIGWVYVHIDDINVFAHRNTSQVSEQTRMMLYRAAGKMLQERPVWGIGLGAMPVSITPYTEWDVKQYIGRLHNDWLEITLGIGYVGAVLWILALTWCAMGAFIRLRRLPVRKQFLFAALLSALVAMCVGSVVDFHFFIPGCALVFFIILGLTNAPTFHKGHVHAWRLPRVVCIVLVVVLASATYIPLQKARCWRNFVFGSGLKTQAKIAAYEQGLSYYPGPHYAVRLGNTYYNAGLHTQDPLEKWYYFELAQELAQTYLEKYPKEKELSQLYLRASKQLN